MNHEQNNTIDNQKGKTLYQKIWDQHVVHPLKGTQENSNPEGLPTILYIDLHLIHEVTSPQAFQGLRDRKLPLRHPEKIIATMDHSIPTIGKQPDGSLKYTDPQAEKQVNTLIENCKEFGVTLHDFNSDYQGIIHVIAPELGAVQPGMTIVCGDSHTSTHGAFGALAHGIGTSEVEHVFATQCLLQSPSKSMEIRIDGKLASGISAKDIILAIIAEIGVGGGTGYVLEYTGSAIEEMSMEGRMTICNMSIEAGARAGLIAPDEKTFAFLKDKPNSPKGKDWDEALSYWKTLKTDDNAVYDKTVILKAEDIEPMVSYGTNPGMVIGIGKNLPNRPDDPDLTDALNYMKLSAGQAIEKTPIDVVFIGSCTNSRMEDLRAAAAIAKNKHVAENMRALVVPGSQLVKKQAEAEGLHEIFTQAGFEWREPGCSMCIAMNGDKLESGQSCASTSNRNFKGRQGQGGRTFLVSPAMAAAAAIKGQLVDVRNFN